MSDYGSYFTSIIRQIIRLSKNVGLWMEGLFYLFDQTNYSSQILSDCRGYFTSIIRHFADFPQMSDYGGYSIIRQFANPTFFSSPIECRIMGVPLYM